MKLAIFILFILFAVACLVIAPVAMHPTLPAKRKWIINIAAFVILVPLAIVLYLWVGVPQMAALS